MGNSTTVWGLLVVAFIAANWPFLSNRIFLIREPAVGVTKPVYIRLLELVVLYFIIGAIGLGLEYRVNGQIHMQDWEFYPITFFLFLVLAMPGFIYRYTYRCKPH